MREATRKPPLGAVLRDMAELAREVPKARAPAPPQKMCRPLSIGLVMKDYAPGKGGGERYFDEVCRELLRRGHRVHAFVRSVEEVPPRGLVLHVLGRARNAKQFADEVKRELLLGRFDVTLALTQVWDADVWRMGGGLQRLWSRARHGSVFLRRMSAIANPGRRFLGRLEEHLLRRAACRRIITNSELVRRQVFQEFNVLPEKVEVVYNGVDLAAFSPEKASEGQAVREELGLPAEAPLILFAANNFTRKGLGTLLRSLDTVRRFLPDVHLVVAGRDRAEPFLRLARRLGVERAVHFVGSRRDMPGLYAASDIFVLPTLYDPCANVCLEALASATPVITTLANGAAEFVRPGETGYLLREPGDHRTLARLLLHFFIRADRARMGRRARESIEGFTYRAHVDRLEDIFASVVGRPTEPGAFEHVGALTVNRDCVGLFRRAGLTSFESVAAVQEVLTDREKRGRRLAKFQLERPDGSAERFYLKAHRLRRRDLFEPLLSLARPVTANAGVEWWGMRELPAMGIRTATPVAFAQRRRWGLELAGLTVSAELKGCVSLEEFLRNRLPPAGGRSPAERKFVRLLVGELARMVRTLHRRGINHQDLYLGHFFIREEQPLAQAPELYLVDLQRLQRRERVPGRYRVKDLGQLLFSAEQFAQVSRSDKVLFFRLYQEEQPLSARSKRLARSVMRKARRIARHTARKR